MLVTAAGFFLVLVAATMILPSLLDIPRPRPDSDDEGCDSSNCPCGDCGVFRAVGLLRDDVDTAADFREWEREVSA